jgi:hypothetical protein
VSKDAISAELIVAAAPASAEGVGETAVWKEKPPWAAAALLAAEAETEAELTGDAETAAEPATELALTEAETTEFVTEAETEAEADDPVREATSKGGIVGTMADSVGKPEAIAVAEGSAELTDPLADTDAEVEGREREVALATSLGSIVTGVNDTDIDIIIVTVWVTVTVPSVPVEVAAFVTVGDEAAAVGVDEALTVDRKSEADDETTS